MEKENNMEKENDVEAGEMSKVDSGNAVVAVNLETSMDDVVEQAVIEMDRELRERKKAIAAELRELEKDRRDLVAEVRRKHRESLLEVYLELVPEGFKPAGIDDFSVDLRSATKSVDGEKVAVVELVSSPLHLVNTDEDGQPPHITVGASVHQLPTTHASRLDEMDRRKKELEQQAAEAIREQTEFDWIRKQAKAALVRASLANTESGRKVLAAIKLALPDRKVLDGPVQG